jgi:hypothetical protein
MNLRDRISQIDALVVDLEDKSAILQGEAWNLRQEKDELIAKLILDEKMLANTNWDLTLGDITNLIHKEVTPGAMDKITELIKAEYLYSTFELEPGVTLHFDEDNVTLSFEDAKLVMPFIRRNGMIIQGSRVTDRLNSLKREIVALETVCHQFNLLKGKP